MKGKHNSHVGNWYLPPTSRNKENLKEFLYLEKEENPKRAEQTNEILKDNKKDRWSPEKRGPKSIKWKRNYNQHHKIHKNKKNSRPMKWTNVNHKENTRLAYRVISKSDFTDSSQATPKN